MLWSLSPGVPCRQRTQSISNSNRHDPALSETVAHLALNPDTKWRANSKQNVRAQTFRDGQEECFLQEELRVFLYGRH